MRNLLILYLLLNLSSLKAQNTSVYGWQEHLSYRNAKCLAEVNENIYCSTKNGLFYYNKNDYTLGRLNKITGLSDVGIASIAYDKINNIIIIVYSNTNIDLIKNDEIINLPDIKDKIVVGEKRINNISIENGLAYLSSTLGLIVVNLKKEEIKDTYKIGNESNFLEITDCEINDTSIIVGTTDGCYYADKNSNLLFDYNNWSKIINSSGHINDITITPLGIIINNVGTYYISGYANNTIFQSNRTHIDLLFLSNSDSITITNSNFIYIQDILIDQDNIIWVADSANSLIKIENLDNFSIIKPDGPSSNFIEKINFEDQKFSVLHNSSINSISITLDLIDWQLINSIENITCSKSIGENDYYGSSTKGLFVIDESNNITNYNLQNTNGILDSSDNIVDLITDNSGNLWGVKSNSSHPLFCSSSDNNWFSYNMPFVASSSTDIGEIIIDHYYQKWGVLKGNGIFVYDDNGTISDINDDQFLKIGTSIGNGNLPNKEVYSIVNDLNGDIWVGTKTGVCVFYSPSSVFSGYNFDAQQIIVEENGFGQYLLNSEIIYSITIDGANRKWIGTLGSGLYLLSEDGTQEIYHFTTENSPLISNTIVDLEVNYKTGEVYIATNKGLMSFRSDATSGTDNMSHVNVFPNPVRQDYNGYISMDGFASESEIKITDISGNLVFQTISNGGMAIWDGRDQHKKKVGTGVYLIFSSSLSQRKGPVGKILFIR